MDDTQKEMTFESALERLETVVAEMESGDVPLETMIARFEEGSKLTAFCRAKLVALQQKIEILAKDDGADGEWAELDATEAVAEKSPQKKRSVRAVKTEVDNDGSDELPF